MWGKGVEETYKGARVNVDSVVEIKASQIRKYLDSLGFRRIPDSRPGVRTFSVGDTALNYTKITIPEDGAVGEIAARTAITAIVEIAAYEKRGPQEVIDRIKSIS